MLPLSDAAPNRYETRSTMTITLIAICTLVMVVETFIEFTDPNRLDAIFQLYGFTPLFILEKTGGGALTTITSLFLHGGPWHLVGNMVFLWVFGRRVEDACGPWRFLFFYLTCGAMANLITAGIDYGSPIPLIGASGAISGVIGAYLLLFPAGRIRIFVLLVYVPIFPRIRAFWLILYWVGTQIPPALNILMNDANYSIGYWAHLGGFFSAILIFLFIRPAAFQRFTNDAPV